MKQYPEPWPRRRLGSQEEIAVQSLHAAITEIVQEFVDSMGRERIHVRIDRGPGKAGIFDYTMHIDPMQPDFPHIAVSFAAKPHISGDTRKRIRDIIGKRPGISRTDLQKAVGQARGSLEHHLRILHEDNLIVTKRLSDPAGFFLVPPPGTEIDLSPLVLRRKPARILLEALKKTKKGTIRSLAAKTGLGRETVTRHLQRLAQVGLVAIHDEPVRHATIIAEPAQVAA